MTEQNSNTGPETTIGEMDISICLKVDCPVITRDEVFSVIYKCHTGIRAEHSGRD